MEVPQTDTRTQPFRNAGASCYINATLQALFGLPAIRLVCRNKFEGLSREKQDMLLGTDHRERDDTQFVRVRPGGPLDGDILLAVTMHSAERGSGLLYPELFLQPSFWKAMIQQDAHEYCLLKLMDSTISEARALQGVLQGETLGYRKCPECLHPSYALGENASLFTAIDIPTHNGNACIYDVQSGVVQYFKEEQVDVAWEECVNCGAICAHALKGFKVTVPPEVLCLKLNHTDGQGNFVFHAVHPTEMITVGETKYGLRSVVFHSGGMDGGHYWAVVRHECQKQDAWWLYNDSVRERVSGPTSNAATRGRAYMLFYARGDASPCEAQASSSSVFGMGSGSADLGSTGAALKRQLAQDVEVMDPCMNVATQVSGVEKRKKSIATGFGGEKCRYGLCPGKGCVRARKRPVFKRTG